MRFWIPALCVVALGCKSERDLTNATWEDTWEQAPNNQVDILWVIDDSYSMKLEQEALADGFSSFISEIETTGTDFHLGVITTSFAYDDPDRGKLIGNPAVITKEDDYVSIFQSRALVGVGGEDKEKGLEAAVHALSPVMTSGPNANFLRRDAQLLVVFLSDENDCSDRGALNDQNADACYQEWDKLVPVTTFVAELRDLKSTPDLVQVSAIVGPEQTAGCVDAVPGFRYHTVAELTGGIVGNICETDWSDMLYDLGLNASGVKTSFQLSRAARVGTLQVFVDDEEVSESGANGWTYDEETWFVTFHGDAVPARGSTIRATYEVQAGAEGPTDTDTDLP